MTIYSMTISWRRKWQPTPVFLPGEFQGRGSLVGCSVWGRTESDTTEATQQQQQQHDHQLEKAMPPHSSTLAWKIPWTEEPFRLQPMGSLRVKHDSATSLSLFTSHFYALEKEMATHSSILAWRIPGTEEPSGLPSMGSHRVGHD